MSLESATYISGLIATNPAGSDPASTADDHLRLIKSVLKNTFPNLNAAVTAAPSEINMLAGRTFFEFGQGTRMLFAQAAAPVGWTQDVADNDAVIRVVNDATGDQTGGNWQLSGISVDSHILSTDEIPGHTHPLLFDGNQISTNQMEGANLGVYTNSDRGGGSNVTGRRTMTVGANTTAGNGHTHTVTLGSGWRPQYHNVIICSKDNNV